MGKINAKLSSFFKKSASGGKQRKAKKRVIALTSLAIGNALAVSAASFAWFIVATQGSELSTISGDMNVKINRITAHKYNYPFYAGSTEFIDYGASPTLKGYVLQDSSVVCPSSPSTTMHLSLSANYSSSDVSSGFGDEEKGPDKVHISSKPAFRYCLMGDTVFTGRDETPSSPAWSTLTANSFAITEAGVATIGNLILSVGAKFSFYDLATVAYSEGVAQSILNYSLDGFEEENSLFQIEGGYLKCLLTGIYDFSFSSDTLTIRLLSDDSGNIVRNNVLDPMMISLDYGVNPEGHESIEDYLPVAIKRQFTMIVLDVEIKYTNINPIKAGLRVIRNPLGLMSPAIYLLPNQYDNTTSHLIGYINGGPRNALLASEFFAYSSCFGKTPFPSQEAMWTAMHQETNHQSDGENNDFVKFDVEGLFKTTLECNLQKTNDAESLIIPGGDEDTYHCYIGIDYDYEYADFFMLAARKGKTYLLDRDFGFYFYGTEYLEEEP